MIKGLIALSLVFLIAANSFGCSEVISKLKVKHVAGKVFLRIDKRKEIIPEAKVKLVRSVRQPDDSDEYETIAETMSDVSGSFAFSNISKGNYFLVVETKFTSRFWGPVKVTRSSSSGPTSREIYVYLGLPLECDNGAELVRVRKD